MTRTALALALFAGPLWQSKGRFVLSLAAIALGVALGFAVQLVNQSAINEFTQAVLAIGQYFGLEATEERMQRFSRNLPIERMHAAREDGRIIGEQERSRSR